MMHATLTILGAFALILLLARCRLPLALAILVGAAGVSISLGLSIADISIAFVLGAVAPRSLAILAVMVLQLMLSTIMETSGQMERIVGLARAVLRRPAIAMAALPALIGLLPMPGGALFSAPMVASAAQGTPVLIGKLSAINFWFRHVWEHWWPVYPGVILALTLTGMPFASFALTQIPLGLIMAASGIPIMRGLHANLHAVLPPPNPGTVRKLALATAPIWIIVFIAVPGSIALTTASFPSLPAWSGEIIRRFVPVALGLAIAVAWILSATATPPVRALSFVANKRIMSMLGLLLCIMIFQHMLSETHAAQRMAEELKQTHVPSWLIVVLLPAIAGAVTGTAFGFVGTSFPIILPLVTRDGAQAPAAYVALAYACGHMGQMLSPLHICYVVSNQYFGTTFAPVYKEIVLPAILTIVLTAAYVALLLL